MASTYADKVYSGTATTDSVDMTSGVAANKTFIMKGFVISNADVEGRTAELLVDDVTIVPFIRDITAGDALIQSSLHIPVLTTKTIKVKGEVANLIDFYVWGIEEDYS